MGLLTVIPTSLRSQSTDKAELIGSVRDNFGSPIGNAIVFNKTKGEIINTGALGDFRMKISTGDTLTLISTNYDQAYFVVPAIENPFLFQDFTIYFNREAALAQYKLDKTDSSKAFTEAVEDQKILLAGRVVSANGDALINANITVGNSLKGTVSNKNGVYELQVSTGDSVYFSFMGHRSQAIYVDDNEGDIVMRDVMLVPTAFMLQGVKVTANKALLNLQYGKTGMDAGEAARYTLRNHAMQTDKTYLPTFGVSTASFGGLSQIFGGKKRKGQKKVSQKVLDRQEIMRKQVLEMENKPDSTLTPEGNL